MVCFFDLLRIAANTPLVLAVLDSFLRDQEVYYSLLEELLYWSPRKGSLALLLLDTHGHTPTHLLHMWRWAESSGAFSGAHGSLEQIACATPTRASPGTFIATNIPTSS